METIGSRLRKIRKIKGLTQEEFSLLIGTKRGNLTKYETDYLSVPDNIKIALLKFDVNLTWLLTGVGEMFITKPVADPTDAPPTFGERVKALREAQKLSLNALAKQAGISASSLSTIENNAQQPKTDTVLTLADFFNVTTDYLIRGKSCGVGCKPAENPEVERLKAEYEKRLQDKDNENEALKKSIELDKQNIRADAAAIKDLITDTVKEAVDKAINPKNNLVPSKA